MKKLNLGKQRINKMIQLFLFSFLVLIYSCSGQKKNMEVKPADSLEIAANAKISAAHVAPALQEKSNLFFYDFELTDTKEIAKFISDKDTLIIQYKVDYQDDTLKIRPFVFTKKDNALLQINEIRNDSLKFPIGLGNLLFYNTQLENIYKKQSPILPKYLTNIRFEGFNLDDELNFRCYADYTVPGGKPTRSVNTEITNPSPPSRLFLKEK